MKAYALYQVRDRRGFIEDYLEAVKEANATNLELLKKEADDIYSRLSSYDKKRNTVEIRLIELDDFDFDDLAKAVEGAENYDVVYDAKSSDMLECNTKEVTESTLALAEELGRIPVSTINDISAFVAEMKAEGWDCYMDETTDYMICEPEDLTGKAWKDLTERQREDLLDTAEAVNGITGETEYEPGEYIIDFVGTEYSVSGRLNEDLEIEIDDEAVIYRSRG